MGIKDWWGGLWQTKSTPLSVTLQVTDDGFMPAIGFGSGSGIGGTGTELETLLTQAAWSYICMTRLAEDAAALTGIVQEWDTESGEWITDKSRKHDLNNVLLYPYGQGVGKPRVGWSWLMELMSLHHDLTGAGLLRIVPDSESSPERLLALIPLPPPPYTKGQERPDNTGILAGWLVPGDRFLRADQVCNIYHTNSGSLWRGLSPLVAADRAIVIDWTSQQRTKYDLEQRIGAGMVVKIKGIFSASEEQRTKTMAALQELHGKASQSGLPLVVGDSTDVVGMPEGTALKDIPTHRRMAIQEIASVFKVPLPVIGIIDKAAYNQYDLALQAYWTLALQPKLNNIYQALNQQAVWPIYGPEVRLWYDTTDNPLGLAVARLKAKAAKEYMDLGYPANSVNRRFNLGMPEFDELERPNMPSVIAGREPGRPPNEEGEPPEIDGDELDEEPI